MNVGFIVTLVTCALFFGTLLVAFFIGFWRGAKRSAMHFGISLALVIISYFVTPPITNAILNISVSYGGSTKTLSELSIEFISKSEAIRSAMENSAALKALIESLPAIVLNIVVFLVVYAIVRLLGYIIFKIVERFTVKSKKQEKELGIKRHRLGGGAIGLVEGLVFFILALAPLNSIVGFVGDLKETFAQEQSEEAHETASSGSSLPSMNELFDFLPSYVMEGIDAYNHGIMGSVVGFLGVDDLIFDEMSKTTIDGEQIKIRQDAINYATLYNELVPLYNIIQNPSTTAKVKNLNWDKIDNISYKVLNSGLIKGLGTNLIADIIVNYEDFNIDFGEFEPIVIALKGVLEDEETPVVVKEYFMHDINAFYSSFSAAGRSGIIDDVLKNNSDMMTLITKLFTQANEEALKTISENILSLNVLHDTSDESLKFVAKALKNQDETYFGNLSTNVESWTTLSQKVDSLVESAVDVNETIDIQQTINNPKSLINLNANKVDTIFGNIGTTLDNLDTLGVFKNGDKTFLYTLLEKFGYEDVLKAHLPEDKTKFNNYTELFTFIAEPIKEVCKMNLYATIDEGENKDVVLAVCKKLKDGSDLSTGTYTKTLSKILLPLYQIDIARDKIMPMIKEIVNETNIINLDALEVGEGPTYDFDASFANWKHDVEMLTRILVEVYATTITEMDEDSNPVQTPVLEKVLDGEDFGDLLKDVNTQNIDRLIKPVLYAKSTKGADGIVDKIFNLIEENVNKLLKPEKRVTLNYSTITLKEGAKEDQATEISTIIKNVVDLLKKFDFESTGSIDMGSIDKEKLGVILDAFKNNAYRVDLDNANSQIAEGKKRTEPGVFEDLFTELFNEMKSKFGNAEELIGSKQPYEINFTNLMKAVSRLETASENSFLDKAQDIIETLSHEQNITTETITEMIDTITNEITQETIEDIKTFVDVANDLGYQIEIPSADENEIESQIDDKVEAGLIDETLANKIKEMLGINPASTETENTEETENA